MRPPSQQLRFPIGLLATLAIAIVTASVLPGSGLVMVALLFAALFIYAARGARPPKPPST